METFADDLNDTNWQNINYTFVTGSSESHFDESKDAIASVQKHFPSKRILYYDWGLLPTQVKMLHTFCNIEYRSINLSKFPVVQQMDNARPFMFYVGKILTVTHALQDYDGIIWMDTSVRFLHGNLTPIFLNARENGGIAFFRRTHHSMYSTTHPDTYKYLPSNLEKLKMTKQFDAAYFIYKSAAIYKNIVWWLHLCAMHKSCIAPVYELECNFPDHDFNNMYSGCHRYDQSVINILMANYFQFDTKKIGFCMRTQGCNFLVVNRTVTKMYEVRICRDNSKPNIA